MRVLIAFILLGAGLAGCVEDAPLLADTEHETALPPVIETAVFGPSQILGRPSPIWGIGGEPSVAVADDGTIYVAAPMIAAEELLASAGHIRVWRSTDGGATFELTNREDGKLTEEGSGNGDADIAIGTAGRVHTVDLGGGIPYRWSDDRGDTWNWGGELNEPDRSVDRQWIDAHGDFVVVTWADQDGDPRGITFTRSSDGGATWTTPVDIVDGMIQLGPIHIAPDGRTLLQPYVTAGDNTLHVLISRDRGTNWIDVDTGHALHRPATPLQNPWSPTVIFPVAAVDAAGQMYLAWSQYADDGSAHLRLSQSSDGENWSEPVAFAGEETTMIFPWIVAGDAGRVAVTYLQSNQLGDPNLGLHQWQVAANFMFFSDEMAVNTASSVSNGIIHTGAVCPNGGGCLARVVPVYSDRTLLDFFEAALTPDGDLVVVWTQTDNTEARNPQVRFARQTDGTRLLALADGQD